MSGRIGGQTRYETAVALADELVAVRAAAGAGPIGGVIVASGEDAAQGIDALSATFLAGVLGAPVLLTERDALPAATATALDRLLGAPGAGRTVHVMGGPAVVSDGVVAALTSAAGPGARVARVQGEDRYATAAAAARLGSSSVGSYALLAGVGARRTALLASGTNPADALSAGPLACAARLPLLLTQRDALPEVTLSTLLALGIGQVVALGGTAAIGTRVLDAVDAAGIAVVTVAGATRYDTAAILLAVASAPPAGGASAGAAEGVFSGGFGLGFADAADGYLANGVRFPDALAAGPVAGAAQRPLYLTAPDGLSPETAGVVSAAATRSLTAVGLAGAVPDAVLAAAGPAADG